MNYRNQFTSYSHSLQPLSMISKSNTFPKRILCQVCVTDRDSTDFKYVYVLEDDTLFYLKEKISRQLNLMMDPTEFSLIKYSDIYKRWVPIDETNIHKTIANLNISTYVTLKVEKHNVRNIAEGNKPKITESCILIICYKNSLKYLDTKRSKIMFAY